MNVFKKGGKCVDITILKDQIMKNKLSNFYIFTGTELGIQKIYLEQISKVLKLPIIRADSVMDIHSQCTAKSLFGDSFNIYVIRDDKEIMKHENIYQTLSNDIRGNVIILLYEKIDKRLNFGKYFKDSIVEFEKLTPTILNSYIKKASGLSNENASRLSNEVSGCYDLAMFECDKISRYSKIHRISADESFEDLLARGVIYQPEESDVFKFTDAVCSGDIKSAFNIARVLQDNKVSAIQVLGTLYNSLKSVLLIQCCSGKDIADITGLDGGQIYFNKKYVGVHNTGMLVQAVQLLIDVIAGIKSGWIDEKYAVNYTMIRMWS